MLYPGIVDVWRWRQTAFPSRFLYVFSHRISCDYLVLWKTLLGRKPFWCQDRLWYKDYLLTSGVICSPCTIGLTKFVPNKLKKLSTLCYCSLINVGIVYFDGRLHHWPSNKPHKYGGTVCCYSRMDVANQPTPPSAPGSLFWRGWPRVVYEGLV